MSERVLVTGATGFVGTRVCAHLDAQGYDVCSCDLAPHPDVENYQACDITDEASIKNTLSWAGALDHVIHLAAMTFVPEAAANPEKVIDVNVKGTISLVRMLEEHTPDTRLLFVSSSEVYGAPQFTPITEDHPILPKNPYAISKAAADFYCAYHSESGSLPIVRMRPFNHSGPGQSDRFVLSSFAKQVADIEKGEREPVLLVGNLDAARDFMHVDDVIRAYEMALHSGEPGEAYNICSGNSYVIGDALKTLTDQASVEIQVEVDPDLLRPVEVSEIRGSHDKLTDATGWKPDIPFEQLLSDLLEHYRK
jgi:GDP-4-dehydro-6-deoxy-D-mannose reductase